MSKFIVLLFCAAVLFGISIAAMAGVPQSINYQAVLLDSQGDPVTTPVDIVFTIYDASSGGNIIWQETKYGVTPDANGQFNLILGKTVPITENVMTGGALWLGIKVGADNEISPRTELVSSAYSFRVNTIDQANAGTIYGPFTIEESLAKADAKLTITCGAKAPDTVQINACGGVILRATNQVGEEVLLANIDQVNQTAELGIRVDGADLALLNAYGIEFHTNVAKDGMVLQKKYVYGREGIQQMGCSGTDILGQWGEMAAGQPYISMTDCSAKAIGASIKIRPPSATLDDVFTIKNSTGEPSFQLQTNPTGVTSMSFENPNAKISDRLIINNDGIFFLNAAKSETLMTITSAGNLIGKGQISMGQNMSNSGDFANVLGFQNTADGDSAAVTGGYYNDATGSAALVSGGYDNLAGNHYAAVGGGAQNTASGEMATISGGYYNQAMGNSCTIVGGYGNVAGSAKNPAATSCFVGGGTNNKSIGDKSVVSGGYGNVANGSQSVVGGGISDSASGIQSVVCGGQRNVASGDNSTIGGGYSNRASGMNSAIPGGESNVVSGSYSLAFGRSVNLVTGQRVAFFDSSWIGALWINRDSDCPGATNHPIHVGTSTANGNGAYLTVGGTWTNGSSRTFKENFRSLDSQELLDKISSLPVEIWQYLGTEEQHIGPVSEDFVQLFDVGAVNADGKRDNKYLSPGDVAGVTLAGLKEVIRENQELKEMVRELRERIARLEKGR